MTSAIKRPLSGDAQPSPRQSTTAGSPCHLAVPQAKRQWWEAFCDRTGVCCDYAHLAVALCRCMTIPARYRTGDLGYIGVSATDFLSLVRSLSQQQWYTFDSRNNVRRIGRVLIAAPSRSLWP